MVSECMTLNVATLNLETKLNHIALPLQSYI